VNILFLTTHLNTGGITTYLLTMAEGLVRRGHHVHVVSSGGNMERDFTVVGVRILVLNIKTKSELNPKIYFALPCLKKYVCEHSIDILHAQTRITQVMGRILKVLTGCPYISTCHGFFKTRYSRRLFPLWGDKVIAISCQVEDHLTSDFRVPAERVQLIVNGVDLEVFQPLDEEQRKAVRAKFGFGKDPLIGIIARLSDVKGQDVLIKSMRVVVDEIPDARLLIVGEGKMKDQLEAMVDQLGLRSHVRFISIVNRTAELLPAFDVFVMPSRQEGLGISIMEAQAAGVPVVASRVGGIPSLIVDGETGRLVPPEDSHALAEAILNLLQDKAQRENISLSAREFIRKMYSADRMVEETIKLYQRYTKKL